MINIEPLMSRHTRFLKKLLGPGSGEISPFFNTRLMLNSAALGSRRRGREGEGCWGGISID